MCGKKNRRCLHLLALVTFLLVRHAPVYHRAWTFLESAISSLWLSLGITWLLIDDLSRYDTRGVSCAPSLTTFAKFDLIFRLVISVISVCGLTCIRLLCLDNDDAVDDDAEGLDRSPRVELQMAAQPAHPSLVTAVPLVTYTHPLHEDHTVQVQESPCHRTSSLDPRPATRQPNTGPTVLTGNGLPTDETKQATSSETKTLAAETEPQNVHQIGGPEKAGKEKEEEGDEMLSMDTSCGICLQRYEAGQILRVLPCHTNHRFHQTCVDPWLQNHRNSCPLCREPLR